MRYLSPALLIRLGLAFTFLYAGVKGIVQPDRWIGFLPQQVDLVPVVSSEQILLFFSVAEIVLAVWLLAGVGTRWAGFTAFLFLLGVTLPNLAQMDIVFRDVGLAACALALVVPGRR